MERLFELYSQIKEQPHGFHAELNVNAFADALIAQFRELKASLFSSENKNEGVAYSENQQKDIEKAINLADTPNFVVSDPKRIFLDNARLIKNAELEQGEVLVPQKDYLYGYKDLSYEEFCSYIYWRTGIRNNNREIIKDTPRGYLYLYLFELSNFVEYNSVEETMLAFNILMASYPSGKHAEMISDAMREFTLLYGTREVAENCIDYDEYNRIRRAEVILKGNYEDTLDYIADYSTKSFKKSAIYRDHEESIRKAFPNALRCANSYLERKNIPFIRLWVGRCSYFPMRFKYIKLVDEERVVDKKVVYGGIIMAKVSNGEASVASMESLGKTKDPGQCVFARAYIMQGFYSVFECELRRMLGARSISLKTCDLWRMGAHSETVSRLAEIFESDEFGECIRKAIIENLNIQ